MPFEVREISAQIRPFVGNATNAFVTGVLLTRLLRHTKFHILYHNSGFCDVHNQTLNPIDSIPDFYTFQGRIIYRGNTYDCDKRGIRYKNYILVIVYESESTGYPIIEIFETAPTSPSHAAVPPSPRHAPAPTSPSHAAVPPSTRGPSVLGPAIGKALLISVNQVLCNAGKKL